MPSFGSIVLNRLPRGPGRFFVLFCMAGTRKIAAILVADIVGCSRLAGTDEDRTLSRLRGLRSDLIDPAIDAHHGRVVKRTGDGAGCWRRRPLPKRRRSGGDAPDLRDLLLTGRGLSSETGSPLLGIR